MTAPGTAREEHQSMEFSVTKSALLNELSTTQGVVERKTTIPILSNLLVEAKGSRLTITATDLELSIRTSCEAKIKKEGAGTIPAKKLQAPHHRAALDQQDRRVAPVRQRLEPNHHAFDGRVAVVGRLSAIAVCRAFLPLQDLPLISAPYPVTKAWERCGKCVEGSGPILKSHDSLTSRLIVFRDFHNSALVKQHCKLRARLDFPEYPQIHSNHHNNKLYSFLNSKKASIELMVLWVGCYLRFSRATLERRKAAFPTYFHRVAA